MFDFSRMKIRIGGFCRTGLPCFYRGKSPKQWCSDFFQQDEVSCCLQQYVCHLEDFEILAFVQFLTFFCKVSD